MSRCVSRSKGMADAASDSEDSDVLDNVIAAVQNTHLRRTEVKPDISSHKSSHFDLSLGNLEDSTQSDVSELYQYINQLEVQKSDLTSQLRQLQFTNSHQANRLEDQSHRIARLESALSDANAIRKALERERHLLDTQHRAEKDRLQALEKHLEDISEKYEHAEKARRMAMVKLSSMDASHSHAFTLDTPEPPRQPRSMSVMKESDSRARLQREVELLRHQLVLNEKQLHEKQRLAVDMALRNAQMEHAAELEKVKLECELKLHEWRYEETVRGKEVQMAVDEDRQSIRLEMSRAIERIKADGVGCCTPYSKTLDRGVDSVMLADENVDSVIGQIQSELVYTRRRDFLQRALMTRQRCLERMTRKRFVKWHLASTLLTAFRSQAAARIVNVLQSMKTRAVHVTFNKWRILTNAINTHRFQHRALLYWNQMVAVERLGHISHRTTIKRMSSAFYRLKHNHPDLIAIANNPEHDPSVPSNLMTKEHNQSNESSEVQSLQSEIQRLHEQLASSKSEAWKYKRQLLQQFV